MKRIFPVLVALVLVLSLTVFPVCAAETYFFDASTIVHDSVYDGFRYDLTDGRYTMTLHVPDLGDPEIPAGDYVSAPFDLVFEKDGDSLVASIAPEFPVDFSDISLLLVYYSYDPSLVFVFIRDGDNLLAYDVSIPFTLTRLDSDSPTLSGVVDSDMMSGVLDHVVSLLPVILGVLVSFIAVRKGISWLQSILHSA